MGFYDDMAKMAEDLLKPDSQGGLGQGEIVLTHITKGVPNPDKPWEPVEPTKIHEPLKGAARGISSVMVGKEVNGTVLLASDRTVICTVPRIAYRSGDVLSIDGKDVMVIDVENIPAAGTASAVKFIVRG